MREYRKQIIAPIHGDAANFFRNWKLNRPYSRILPAVFYRFGLPREEFQTFLAGRGHFDFTLTQTGMTYWYLGVQEMP